MAGRRGGNSHSVLPGGDLRLERIHGGHHQAHRQTVGCTASRTSRPMGVLGRAGHVRRGHGSRRKAPSQDRPAAHRHGRRRRPRPGLHPGRLLRADVPRAIGVHRADRRSGHRPGLRRAHRRRREVVPRPQGHGHRAGRRRVRLRGHALGQAGRKLVRRTVEHDVRVRPARRPERLRHLRHRVPGVRPAGKHRDGQPAGRLQARGLGTAGPQRHGQGDRGDRPHQRRDARHAAVLHALADVRRLGAGRVDGDRLHRAVRHRRVEGQRGGHRGRTPRRPPASLPERPWPRWPSSTVWAGSPGA